MKSIWDVSADIRAGRLVVVLPEWRTPDVPLYALYQRSRYMAPRVRVLIDFLAVRFTQMAADMAPWLADPAPAHPPRRNAAVKRPAAPAPR